MRPRRRSTRGSRGSGASSARRPPSQHERRSPSARSRGGNHVSPTCPLLRCCGGTSRFPHTPSPRSQAYGPVSERFEVAHLEELDRLEGEFVSHPVRTRFGITAFGVNAYSGAKAGGRIIEEHDELGGGAGHHEELYVVLSGHARFVLDGEARDAPAGTFVFVRDPAVRREAFAEE